MKRLSFLVPSVVLLLAGAAAASSIYAPQKPTTVQMAGKPCSVTEFGPTFIFGGSSITMKYGGGTSCAGGIGSRSLSVIAQVENGSRWFTITGSGVRGGPAVGNPLRVRAQRNVFLGHAYRIVATGSVRTGSSMASATARSGAWAP